MGRVQEGLILGLQTSFSATGSDKPQRLACTNNIDTGGSSNTAAYRCNHVSPIFGLTGSNVVMVVHGLTSLKYFLYLEFVLNLVLYVV